MDNKPHVIAIAFPAQGHVMPLVKLAFCLVDRGFRVTLVNTEPIHDKLLDSSEKGNGSCSIDMVTISDGLTHEERNNPMKQLHAVHDSLPLEFEKLLKKIMESSTSEKITCVIADETIAWALEVAMKMGIRTGSFVPTSAAIKALTFNIPKLIETGVIDENGTVKKNETLMLSPRMPAMKTTQLPWHLGDSHLQQKIFQSIFKHNQILQSVDWILCNTSDNLEHPAISLIPNLLHVGPLLASNQVGNLWPEDSTCLNWLNQQATSSVIYVAFGSHAILHQQQFHELAVGLELLGRPFLWVVREDDTGGCSNTFPDGFQDRVVQFGKIVSWAPQQKVLAHPSTACFVSHCGWNSVMDGLSMGVPFITWPSFGDQFCNETYITDVWHVGLGLDKDENENRIVTRDEIKRKLDQLLGDEVIRGNSRRLKQNTMLSVGKGGLSSMNFERFIEEMKR